TCTARRRSRVRQLADNGLAVIVISHNLNDVFQVADNIAAMYLGTMAAQVEKKSVSPSDVVKLITTGKSEAVSGATK
ncbi:MAG: sugar ABC transporter ATP-binding protein, partial [Actinomycetota bacterium]